MILAQPQVHAWRAYLRFVWRNLARDVESADLNGVSGTPTLLVNGRRHYGAYDFDALTLAIRTARARAAAVSTGTIPAAQAGRHP